MFIVAAIVIGIVIGLLRGGSLSNLGSATFRVWPLLVLGVVVQGAAAFMSGVAVPLILTSLVILLLFAAANIHHPGMGVVLVGIGLNFAVMTINAGMPVRAEAIVSAGIVESEDQIAGLDFGPKRHLETANDRMTVLADIIPVPVVEEVLSFGDLAMSVGVADVLVHLLRRRKPSAESLSAPSAL